MRVIVIGAGVLGASTAYHLARAGAEVVLVDAAHEGRATMAGAGIVCPWSARVDDPDWYRLSSGGARYYPELVAALGEDGETELGYRRVGALCVPGEQATLDEVERIAQARRQDAPEAGTISRLKPTEARALFPPLRTDFEALHVSGGARVDGRLLAAGMARAAERHGAIHRLGRAALLMQGDRVRAVDVEGEHISGDLVVAAPRAWAPELLRPTGIGLSVVPQRGQIVHLRIPDADTRNWPVLLPLSHHYLLAFDDSRVVVGATREAGSGFDDRITAAGLAQVLTQALAVAPGLANAGLIETRVGFRPMGPDMKPLLGGLPQIEGLLIGTGLGSSGLSIGPFAGKLLAALALGQAPELDVAPYTPVRALTGAPNAA